VAVSDTHLGFDQYDNDAFRRFVKDFLCKQERIDHLILLGDFLDLWRRKNSKLIKENKEILKQLVELKGADKIGEIHYVIGNHDYIIETMKKDYASLDQFNYVSGSSATTRSLELPLEGVPPFQRKFILRHGHQDAWGAGQISDAICNEMCHQGEWRGAITSWAWDYPIRFFFFLGILAATFFGIISWWLWLLGAIIIAPLIGVSVVLWQKRKPPSQEEQAMILFRNLPKQTRRRIIDYLSQPPETREGLGLLSEKEIQDGLRRVKRRIPDIETKKAVAELNLILKDQRRRKYTPPTHGYLIVGHTHVKDAVGRVWNLGCWEKNEKHWYLTINEIGHPEMNEWK